MRSFRTAAVAGITALALSMGTASIATAEETTNTNANLSSALPALSSGGFGAVGDEWDAGTPVTGEDSFGEENSRDNLPAWVQNMYDLTWLGAIASVLGVLVFPAYNYLVYTGVLK